MNLKKIFMTLGQCWFAQMIFHVTDKIFLAWVSLVPVNAIEFSCFSCVGCNGILESTKNKLRIQNELYHSKDAHVM